MTTLKLLVPNDHALKQLKALAKDVGASIAEEATDTQDRATKIKQAVAFWRSHHIDFNEFKFNREEANER